ncbi:MAG: glycosyltransferase family 4 protein [Pseudomonadales bacterium]|nr:glycosyltransferase family 4 protein [Pseudomonadales bacterium]
MKIIHLAKYYLPHLGGVEIHLKEINSLLVKMGHEVIVITEQHDLKLSETANCDGVIVMRIPHACSEKKIETWKYFLHLKDLFESADIIHVHDVFWWILPIYKLIKNKVFITFHGWETKFPVEISAKIQRLVYSNLAIGSIHVGSYIQKFYFDKPDYITYGAINPKRLTKSNLINESQEDQNELYGNKNEINIAFLGRLSRDNEVEKFIKLVKLFRAKEQRVNIVWVGEGELSEECANLGKVTGFVKNVSRYLVKKDLIFATSYLSILEAQITGNTVCAFYSNKLKKAYLEDFPGSKYMLIAENIESMNRKIIYLFGSPKFKKISELNAKDFAQKQTWKKVLNIYLKLWKKSKSYLK